MVEVNLVLGRTARQGVGANIGKASPAFREATAYIEVSRHDAEAGGLAEGQTVEVSGAHGSVRLPCRIRDDSDLPPGVAFMPYGPLAGPLMGGETHGTGMPDSKNLPVSIKAAGGDGP